VIKDFDAVLKFDFGRSFRCYYHEIENVYWTLLCYWRKGRNKSLASKAVLSKIKDARKIL